MKTKQFIVIRLIAALAAVLYSGSAFAEISKEVLDSISTPNKVKTSIGTLKFLDGAPYPQTAEKVYPVLHTVEAVAEPTRTTPPGSATAWVSRQPRPVTRRVEPHRGALILILGIMSWMSCPLFGVFAWAMGSADLRKMQMGRMDREGRSLTQAGQILGMVHVVLVIVFLTLFVFSLLLMAVAA